TLLRCLPGLRTLRSVLRAALLAVFHARGIERSANDVITHSRQVLHTAAAHEHDRVLLQVVADAGDVRGDFNGIREANAGDLAESGVRLLRRLRVDADAHTALFRAAHQRRRLRLGGDALAAHSYQLRKCRHSLSSLFADTNSARECTRVSTALASRAQKSARAHQAERCTAIPETSKKLRTHSKRQNDALGFD